MKRTLRAAGRKLRSSRGESIGEVLIAVLIAALALLMLAEMIASSTRLITQSKAKMSAYYDANNALTEQAGDGTLTGSVTLADESNTAVKLENGAASQAVTYYVNETSGSVPVVSYSKGS